MTLAYPVRSIALGLSLLGLVACSQQNTAETITETQPPASTPTPTASTSTPTPSTDSDLTRLFSKIWRLSAAPSDPAPGSILVFLPNGTLLQTSCVETYQVAGWTVDKDQPQILQVSENGQPTYQAEILELTDATLRLQLQLIPTNETQALTLTAVEDEFVCPDLPR